MSFTYNDFVSVVNSFPLKAVCHHSWSGAYVARYDNMIDACSIIYTAAGVIVEFGDGSVYKEDSLKDAIDHIHYHEAMNSDVDVDVFPHEDV